MWDSHGTKLFNEKEQKKFDLFVKQSKIEIIKIKPNVSWLQDLSGVL